MSRRPLDVLAAMRAQAPDVAPLTRSASPPAATSRGDVVRFTFDVSKSQHRFIKQFVLESDTTASAATRLLWRLVQEDSALAERLRAALSNAHA